MSDLWVVEMRVKRKKYDDEREGQYDLWRNVVQFEVDANPATALLVFQQSLSSLTASEARIELGLNEPRHGADDTSDRSQS